MIIYINVRNEGGEPCVSKCYLTEKEAVAASCQPIEWTYGTYWPDFFAVAVPVVIDVVREREALPGKLTNEH